MLSGSEVCIIGGMLILFMGSFMDLVDTEKHIALLRPNMYLSSALLQCTQFSGQGLLDKASALPCDRLAVCSTLNSY